MKSCLNLFEFGQQESDNHFTHYLFRYPAKFHPPVARALLERYTKKGDRVLDCFCGSGTLLVECALTGRNGVGTDVDPVAVFVTRVKSRPLSVDRLERVWQRLDHALRKFARAASVYESYMWCDLQDEEYLREIADLDLPTIPRLHHWFRRYVIIDLARIKREIDNVKATKAERDFFLLCFASIIRNCSNADPVPVSGLEVTRHMRQRDEAGRLVNPFAAFAKAVRRSLAAMERFWQASDHSVSISSRMLDATKLGSRVRGKVDALITSPPYHGAVDYYRRHQLEMYWLGFTRSHEERLALLDQYIGRLRVPARDPLLQRSKGEPTSELEAEMKAVNSDRASGFRHYSLAMRLVFEGAAKVLRQGTPFVAVVGHSTWNGAALNTSALFERLSEPWFELDECYSYPVRNRYMSYSRRNNASISREYVLVLRRLDGKVGVEK